MNAAPDVQLQLLDLQALDSALDRLAHRRRSLPELEQVTSLTARIGNLDGEIVIAETEDRDLGREQKKIEDEVELVQTRMQRDQQRLDAGSVSSPKELENLQSEIESLRRRQGDLEDGVLELMEQRDEVQSRVSSLRTTRDEAAAELAAAEQRRDSAFAEIDAETEKTKQQRGELAASLPPDLVGLYEKIRTASAGVGAAALHRGRCEGCHLQLNTTDLTAIRDAAPDAIVRCEECRRILVRTPESGL